MADLKNSTKRKVLYASRTYERHEFCHFVFLAPRFHDREFVSSREEEDELELLRIAQACTAQYNHEKKYREELAVDSLPLIHLTSENHC